MCNRSQLPMHAMSTYNNKRFSVTSQIYISKYSEWPQSSGSRSAVLLRIPTKVTTVYARFWDRHLPFTVFANSLVKSNSGMQLVVECITTADRYRHTFCRFCPVLISGRKYLHVAFTKATREVVEWQLASRRLHCMWNKETRRLVPASQLLH
jgi:hypothetical protein